jgi:hypothetical protein
MEKLALRDNRHHDRQREYLHERGYYSTGANVNKLNCSFSSLLRINSLMNSSLLSQKTNRTFCELAQQRHLRTIGPCSELAPGDGAREMLHGESSRPDHRTGRRMP